MASVLRAMDMEEVVPSPVTFSPCTEQLHVAWLLVAKGWLVPVSDGARDTFNWMCPLVRNHAPWALQWDAGMDYGSRRHLHHRQQRCQSQHLEKRPWASWCRSYKASSGRGPHHRQRACAIDSFTR